MVEVRRTNTRILTIALPTYRMRTRQYREARWAHLTRIGWDRLPARQTDRTRRWVHRERIMIIDHLPGLRYLLSSTHRSSLRVQVPVDISSRDGANIMPATQALTITVAPVNSRGWSLPKVINRQLSTTITQIPQILRNSSRSTEPLSSSTCHHNSNSRRISTTEVTLRSNRSTKHSSLPQPLPYSLCPLSRYTRAGEGAWSTNGFAGSLTWTIPPFLVSFFFLKTSFLLSSACASHTVSIKTGFICCPNDDPSLYFAAADDHFECY